MNLSPAEEAELRALVYAAWPHRDTPELDEHLERIVEWAVLRPVARGDIEATRELARELLDAEIERLERRRQRLSWLREREVDDLVALLRRTDPNVDDMKRAA